MPRDMFLRLIQKPLWWVTIRVHHFIESNISIDMPCVRNCMEMWFSGDSQPNRQSPIVWCPRLAAHSTICQAFISMMTRIGWLRLGGEWRCSDWGLFANSLMRFLNSAKWVSIFWYTWLPIVWFYHCSDCLSCMHFYILRPISICHIMRYVRDDFIKIYKCFEKCNLCLLYTRMCCISSISPVSTF